MTGLWIMFAAMLLGWRLDVNTRLLISALTPKDDYNGDERPRHDEIVEEAQGGHRNVRQAEREAAFKVFGGTPEASIGGDG